MKKIDTKEYLENIDLSIGDIKKLIIELPFDIHQYIVLYEDESDNYIQTTLENPELDEESRYLIEARVYNKTNNFKHYRTFANTTQEVIAPFEAFYNNTPFSYENWSDVTSEFGN